MTYFDLVRRDYTGRFTGGDGVTHIVRFGDLRDFVQMISVHSACGDILVHVRQYIVTVPATCLRCVGMANIARACTTEEFNWGDQ